MKKILFSTLLIFIALGLPAVVFAQTPATITINPSLPGITNVSMAGPCGWIVGFYNFALIIAGILAFGAVVYGGYLYATSAGNASRQGEGRSWIMSALIGVLLLGAAYLILYTINPGLTKCSLPSLSGSGVVAGTSGTNGTGGTTTGGGGSTTGGGLTSGGPTTGCVAPTNGPCSLAQLQNTCLGSSNLQQAAGICNRESGGNANAQGDKCADGNAASIGLFQINVSGATIKNSAGQTLNCPSAFNHAFTSADVGHPTCMVVNQSLYQQCVAAMMDPSTNVANTCADSSNGTNWKYWSTSGSSCTVNGQ